MRSYFVSSITGNRIKPAAIEFKVQGPVFTLDKIAASDKGKVFRNVQGLPVNAGDAWTMNAWVRMDKQPTNHTILAAAFLTLGWFRERKWYRNRVSIPLSVLIALVALVWFVQRII